MRGGPHCQPSPWLGLREEGAADAAPTTIPGWAATQAGDAGPLAGVTTERICRLDARPSPCLLHVCSLRQIAALAPSTLTQLAAVSGVGEAKLARYGQQILDVLGG
jgi:ATP-dependent DNA helicase RecQ